MAASTQATHDRLSVFTQARDADAKLYKMGWLVGMTVGALALLYRYAG